MFGSAGTWGNACNWYNNYSGSKSSSNPAAGDVIVWDWSYPDYAVEGHVAVIERINPDGTAYISECNWSRSLGFDNQTIALGTDRPGNNHSFPFIGYLHCGPGGGGGGYWDPEPGPTYGKTACTDQKNPSLPDPNVICPPIYDPEHGRAPDSYWVPGPTPELPNEPYFYTYTDERIWNYATNDWGAWTEISKVNDESLGWLTNFDEN